MDNYRVIKRCKRCNKKGHLSKDCIVIVEEENEPIINIYCYICCGYHLTSDCDIYKLLSSSVV